MPQRYKGEEKEYETEEGKPKWEKEEEKMDIHSGADIHATGHGRPHDRTGVNSWKIAADRDPMIEHRKSETKGATGMLWTDCNSLFPIPPMTLSIR